VKARKTAAHSLDELEVSVMECKHLGGFVCSDHIMLIISWACRSIAAGRQKLVRSLELSLKAIVVITVIGLTSPRAQAEEYRHHEAHEHGVAHLNVAVEGSNLYIEFTSPAANIVGFEHHPSTQEQKVAIQKAIEKLKAGETLFILPPGAEGQFVKSTVDTDIVEDFEHESDAARTDEHGESHKEAHTDTNYREEEHEADKNEHERHSEFKADYRFVCKSPEKLDHMDVMLFRLFPGIEKIEVQLLTATKQTALELTAKNSRVAF
jgi:hypothetical protein